MAISGIDERKIDQPPPGQQGDVGAAHAQEVDPQPAVPSAPPGPSGRSPDPDGPEPDEPSGSSLCGPKPNPNGTSVTSGLLALPCSPR